MKKISILGSTGSIGKQALEVIDSQDDIKVVALSANNNAKLLAEQARRYKTDAVCIANKDAYTTLKTLLNDTDIKIYAGTEYLSEVSAHKDADAVLTSVVGNVGLKPTVDAIESKKDILLANKETLVTGGEFIMPLAKNKGVNILPVDSEHSAIFQSLKSGAQGEVFKILLTCSGGPFYGKKAEELCGIMPENALKHPNWDMGAKITIDSATLMNKGLEVIEAKWLFDVDVDDIEVYVHRQSIVHSMVEFCDGSVIAQLGIPDMKLPIQYALNYPLRLSRVNKRLNLFEVASLTFEKPDADTFRCLKIAYDAIKKGGIIPTVMNAANEIAVAAFLEKKIGFLQIADVVEETVNAFDFVPANLANVMEYDLSARSFALDIVERV